jgi:hypothetical protein
MKKLCLLVTVLTLVLLLGRSHSDTGTMKEADHSQPFDGETKILNSWQGDYPVAQLKLLPNDQRDQPVGFIDDAETFEDVWKAFKPGEDVPEIEFKANLLLLARNI